MRIISIETNIIRDISVWRPLYRSIQDCPLAFCDAQTINEDDLLATDRVAPDLVFELYSVKYNPRQKWYWLSGQTPEEVAMFVQFDSDSARFGKPINSMYPQHN